jgi:hypothetical protein
MKNKLNRRSKYKRKYINKERNIPLWLQWLKEMGLNVKVIKK